MDYDGDIPYSKRIETVLQWLKGAEGIYPDFLMLYLEKVDKAGHTGGPDSLEVSEIKVPGPISLRACTYL